MMALQRLPARAGTKSRVKEATSLPQIPALLQFLEGLAANNNRSWFLHNKPQHEILHEEFIALVEAVGTRVRAHDPAVEAFDTAKAVYRIHRDVRFTADKSPYKTHMGGVIGTRNVADKSRPIYYFQIDRLGILTMTAGIYLPPADVLQQIRNHIVAKPHLLTSLLADSHFLKSFGGFSAADRLTRPPKGYAPDLPHVELIMNRHFICEATVNLKAAPVTDLALAISTRFETAAPMMAWLRSVKK